MHVDKVKAVNVPQYKNLTIDKVLAFAKEAGPIEHYLPDDQDIEKLPKQWLRNMCAAVMGSTFREWVSVQIEDSNAEMADKRNMMIDMDPEIAAVFQQSTAVSSKCIDLPLSLTILFVDHSGQGRLREHAAGRQQAAAHQEADRGGEAGRSAQETADRG